MRPQDERGPRDALPRGLNPPGRLPARGPRFSDWAQLAICLAFCIGGVLIWIGGDRQVGLVTLVFFGACAVVAVVTLRRKLREDRFRADVVHVRGSLDIEAARAPSIATGSGMLIVGAVMTFVATSYPWLFRALGVFIGLVGAVVLAIVALGVAGRRYLRFEPEGLVIGRFGYRIRIPWDAISRVAEFEMASNSMVGLDLADTLAVEVLPDGKRAKFERDCARSRGWQQVDIALLPRQFGLDAPPLVAALIRYVSDPAARAELAASPAIAARRIR